MHSLRHALSLIALVATLQAQTPPVPAASSLYVLRPGDAVQVRFFYDPELNEDAQIRPDGTLSLALVGDVQFSGKTPGALATELQTRYQQILKRPAITVQVKSYGSMRIYVGGEVNRPGSMPLVERQSVLDALLESGGPKHTARDYAVLIRRNTDGSASMLRVSVKSPVRNQAPEAATVMLQSFDVILLPESKIARVDRWVDEYIRQVLPGTLNGGFTYLFNNLSGAVVP